ncbi:MAG: hypothetical protein ACYTEQ_10745 [Planctomycetota bacterium]|jgi:regulator of replication initiation timing
MRTQATKTLLWAIGICLVVGFIVGCEEEQATAGGKMDAKRTRLIAVENAQLKKELQELRIIHARQMDRQKKLLDQCRTEKKALEELTDQTINQFMSEASSGAVEENSRLRAENERLKDRIAGLESEIERLRR